MPPGRAEPRLPGLAAPIASAAPPSRARLQVARHRRWRAQQPYLSLDPEFRRCARVLLGRGVPVARVAAFFVTDRSEIEALMPRA